MTADDLVRLRHMLESSEEAIGFVTGKSRSALDRDRLLTLGLLKSLEIVGEAAARVSTETRNSTQEIPWAGVIGMRNHLVHVYFDLDLDLIWRTVQHDLPPLVDAVRAILGEMDAE